MTSLLNIIIFVILAYLQASFLKGVSIFEVVPNVVLIFMVSLALYRKNYESYAFAFIFGLFLDTISGGPYGLFTAVFMFVVFVSNIFFSEDKTAISNAVFIVFQLLSSLTFYAVLAIYIAIKSGQLTSAGVWFLTLQTLITTGLAVLYTPFAGRFFSWEESYDLRSKKR